ncbi:hypothetical protein AB0M36_35560 [Actinoplanes sp. NPDC051346]|uniref:hypothetical protein n=1 Tax=Actinoplanes sp. NPDC051346 TaxID=3155048 RepID=UPI00341E008E
MDQGHVVGDVQCHATSFGAEVVEGTGGDVLDADVDEGDAERAGLQAAHVEQVGHEPVQAIQGFVGGGEQFIATRASTSAADQALPG